NPSRAELLGNWWVRRRWSLATHAGYLLVIAILAFGVVDRVKEWLKPPIETLPTFQLAVWQVHNGQFNRAKGPLQELVDEYPNSVVLKFYYCVALDTMRDKDKKT